MSFLKKNHSPSPSSPSWVWRTPRQKTKASKGETDDETTPDFEERNDGEYAMLKLLNLLPFRHDPFPL